MKILNCKELRDSIIKSIKEENDLLFKEDPPSLAIILATKDEASKSYIKSKTKACKEVGFNVKDYIFDESVSENEVINLIHSLDGDKKTDGILVQLPLPSRFNEKRVINEINSKKDVDGFTKENMGALALEEENSFIPCTAKGILEIFKYFNIETKGKNVVILSRSNIVGKPLSLLLMQHGKDSSVTVLNSFSKDIKLHTLSADILVSAVGKPNFIDSSFVSDGTIIIDVGINRVVDRSKKSGYRVTGDVNVESLEERDVSITPVPGGVGLMTVSALMENTLLARKWRENE